MIGMENQEIDRTVTVGQPDITSILCNLSKQQSAPDVDVDVFDGNPLEYHNFMTLFHELVEKHIDDPRGRLTQLHDQLHKEHPVLCAAATMCWS